MAIRKGGDKLVISNLEEAAYPTMEFSTDPKQAGGSEEEQHENP